MEKREKNSNVDEEMLADEQRAVFVDTDLDTHFAVVVSPLSSVLSLKRHIGDEHVKHFPDCGKITIKSLLVKHSDNYYHLPDTMLLKTAFYGVADSWFVFADVWAPVESQNHCYLEPSPQHRHDCNQIEPAPQHQYEFKHSRSPPQRRATPDVSCKKRKRGEKESKTKCEIDNDKFNVQHNKSSKQKKKTKSDLSKDVRSDLSKDVQQVSKSVQPKDGPNFSLKQQLDEKTSQWSNRPAPRTGEDCGFQHLVGHEGHHVTSSVQPSSMLLEDGDDVVKFLEVKAELVNQLEGTSMSLAETPKKVGIDSFEPPLKSRKKRKNKKRDTDVVDQSPAATSVQGPDILVKGDTPSGNKNHIDISKREGIKNVEEVSWSQPNNVPELLSQHNLLNLGKEIVVDSASLESDKTATKRNTKEGEHENKRTDEMVLELHVNNVSELSPLHEPLKLVDRKNVEEVDAPLKLDKTTKKKRKNKFKSSSTENQDLSNKKQYGGEVDDTRHIHEELSLPVDRRLEESLETRSGNLKMRSHNKKAVLSKDPPASTVKEQPDEQIRVRGAPITVMQNDKLKKRSQKKQPIPAQDLSGLLVNQHVDEATVEMNSPKRVEQADNVMEICKRNDVTLKSKKSDKKRKIDDNEQEHNKTVDDVSASYLNNIPEQLSQHESLNLVGVKEIEEDTKKWKNNEAKSSSIDIQDLSSKRQNDDRNAEDSRYMSRDFLLLDNTSRPVESIEIMSPKVTKSSWNKKAVPGKDPPESPVKEQPHEEIKVLAASVTVNKSDKPKKKNQKKQSVHPHLEGSTMKLDAPKRVEPADDFLTNCDIVDGKNPKNVLQGEGHRDKLSEISPSKVPSDIADLRHIEEPRSSKRKAKISDQASSVDTSSVTMKMGAPRRADDLLTESENSVAKNQQEVPQGEDHLAELSQAPHLQVSTVSAEASLLEKPLASKQKTKKFDQPSSIDTSSTGHLSLKQSRGSARSSEIQTSITDEKHDKSLPNNLEENHAGLRRSSRLGAKEAMNPTAQKKGFLASSGAIFDDGTSSSSEDEDTTDASSSSTTVAPDNLSSSDFSEGENNVGTLKGDSPKTIGSSKPNVSGLKLESIFRSSSSYKKAKKMVASQMEDESQPVEFVPDSQANV